LASLAARLDDRTDDGAVSAARFRAARQGAALDRLRRAHHEAAE
jgi:hypothetical protein